MIGDFFNIKPTFFDVIKKTALLEELSKRIPTIKKWTSNEFLDFLKLVQEADLPQQLGIFRHKYRKGVRDE